MSSLKLRTEDDILMKVDKRVVNFSELINTLNENYEIDLGKPLTGIRENEIDLLIQFCEACDYSPIQFEKPIWKKTFKNYYFSIISKNKKLEEFYNELNYDKLCKYFRICYFYDSIPLKEFLYFKLYDIFNDEKKCIEFFTEDKKIIEDVVKIDDAKKNLLYNKYQDFIMSQIESLSPEEINNYCLQYYP